MCLLICTYALPNGSSLYITFSYLKFSIHGFVLSYLVKIPSGQSPHHLQCIQSRRYTKSQLLDGQDAGLFTDVGRVANPQICTRLCCEDPSCDLAYMFGRTCFLVKCYSERSCRTIPDEEARRNDTNFDRSTQYIIRRKFGVRLRDGKDVSLFSSVPEWLCKKNVSFYFEFNTDLVVSGVNSQCTLQLNLVG